MRDWKNTKAVRYILAYVEWFRQRSEIRPTPGIKPEFSGFAQGEFRNLLYVQLVTTPEFQDGWLELQSRETQDGVLAEIMRDKAFTERQNEVMHDRET